MSMRSILPGTTGSSISTCSSGVAKPSSWRAALRTDSPPLSARPSASASVRRVFSMPRWPENRRSTCSMSSLSSVFVPFARGSFERARSAESATGRPRRRLAPRVQSKTVRTSEVAGTPETTTVSSSSTRMRCVRVELEECDRTLVATQMRPRSAKGISSPWSRPAEAPAKIQSRWRWLSVLIKWRSCSSRESCCQYSGRANAPGAGEASRPALCRVRSAVAPRGVSAVTRRPARSAVSMAR